jgi:hypothetical protein
MNTMTIPTSAHPVRRMRKLMGWTVFASGAAFLIERLITGLV